MKGMPYSVLWFCIMIITALNACTDSSELTRVAVEDRQLGLHCLEPNGTHRGLTRQIYVIRNMEPDTFEHYYTSIYPIDINGMHELYMAYDGLDTQGQDVGGEVFASIRNDDCAATITRSMSFTSDSL